MRATEKGGKRVTASVFFSPFSFFPASVGLGFRLMMGRLFPRLKLNFGLKVVTLTVVVVAGEGVVGERVVGAGVRNSGVVNSGSIVCSSSSGAIVVILGLWNLGNTGNRWRLPDSINPSESSLSNGLAVVGLWKEGILGD